jgi:hypothetical protein
MECSPLSPFQKANPGLKPIPTPGYGCIRQVTAGGFVSDMLLHPSFTPFQYTFRRLPSIGLYTASQQHLNTIECGAFTVPKDQALAVAEYRFQLYRTSGIAGEALPLESGRLPLQIGYDINVDQMRQANLRTEIIPTVASDRQEAATPALVASAGDGGVVGDGVTIYGSSVGVPDETPTTPASCRPRTLARASSPRPRRASRGPSAGRSCSSRARTRRCNSASPRSGH